MIDEKQELFNVIEQYEKGLDILDDYDHQNLKMSKGSKTIYRLTYQECRELIDTMKFGNNSSIFGVEKVKGKLNGIIEAVYQNVFGKEIYESAEEKAAHLLYFLVKDHPFVDGCKRIAATLFIQFLYKNHLLYRDGQLVLSNNALAAITLLIAESKAEKEEMETMIKLVVTFLTR